MTNKIPPQAIDYEKAVLGAMLLDKSALDYVEQLQPEMFYSTANQLVFAAIQELSQRSQVDMITVTEQLKGRGQLETIGGPAYITGLTNKVVSSAHTATHVKRIINTHLLRQLIKVGGELYTKSYDELADPFELIEACEKEIHSLTLQLNQNEVQKVDSVLIDVARELEEKRHRKHYLTGITTGFPALDRHTCGWQPTDFIILAARPKCGKTAMALSFAVNAAMNGEGVAFFSMEMSAKQLVKRVLANKASMYLHSLRDARLDDGQMTHLYEQGIQKLAGIDLYIDDTAALSVSELKAKARRLIKKYGVKMLVVDYLQLMQPEKSKKGQNREQEVATMARSLKIAAKELNVPIICLSQLSRAVESRASHIPQLSDLRESGAIEQDADMVAFLYKPSEEERKQDADKQRLVTFRIAAFRNGDPDKSFEFDFFGEYQRFEERGEAVVKELPTAGRWRSLNDTDFPGSRSYRPTGTDNDYTPF